MLAGCGALQLRRSRRREVLDVGTGTGVLARARARGALAVVATDIPPAALASAAHNATLGGHVITIAIADAASATGSRGGLVLARQ